jgi:hypothetical protein
MDEATLAASVAEQVNAVIVIINDVYPSFSCSSYRMISKSWSMQIGTGK